MLVFVLVMTLVALVLSNGGLLVVLLIRLAEEHRDIGDVRRTREARRRQGHIPADR